MNFNTQTAQAGGARPRVTWRGAVLALAGTILLLAAGAPAAQAATYTYVDDLATEKGEVRYSGTRSSVTGGSAFTILGVGTTTITTYYGYPGYSVVASAASNNPYPASLYHTRVSDARSKCYWWLSGVDGSADMTCSVKS